MTTLICVEFGLLLSGLACLFLGGVATALSLRRLRPLPWPCLAVFGFGLGAALWIALWAHLRDVPFAVEAAGLLLTAASLASLCEFGRRGLQAAGRRIAAPLLYGPAVGLIAAATWAATASGEIAGLQAVCRYTLALPGGLLAGLALWRAADASSRKTQRPLRWAAAALLAWTPACGLVVPAAAFFPASWLNEETFWTATRLPVELLWAGCLLATMTGVWWHQRGPEWTVRRPGLIRRWLLPASFVILAGCGWVTTARLARSHDADADQYAIALSASDARGEAAGVEQAAAAEGSAGWSKMSSRRLSTGLPIILITLVVLGGMAAVAAKLADRHPRRLRRG